MLAHLKYKANIWEGLWECGDTLEGQAYEIAEGTAIPKDVDPEVVRRFAKRFKASATAVEGMHPRWPADVWGRAEGVIFEAGRWTPTFI